MAAQEATGTPGGGPAPVGHTASHAASDPSPGPTPGHRGGAAPSAFAAPSPQDGGFWRSNPLAVKPGFWRSNPPNRLRRRPPCPSPDSTGINWQVSPVIRQTLHHWALDITPADLPAAARRR